MFKKIFIIILALVCILSVSAISAADYNNVDNDVGTFTDLANDIANGGNISLTKDYIQTDSYGQINITKNTNINGNGHTIDAKGQSGIFTIDKNVTVSLNNIIFINGNAAEYGGAIYSEGTVLIVNDCQFKNTTSINSGGGAIYGVNVTVIGSNFINTTATNENGGAIYGNTISISNSTFIGTKADLGGAIFGLDDIKVVGSTFIGTKADFGGAICGWSIIDVINSTFNNITAEYDGGAIYGSDVIVNDSIFTNTTAKNGCGGAIFADFGSVNVTGSIFNHTSAGYGGAIYALFKNVVINSTFIDTTATEGTGGAVESANNIVVINSTFINTSAEYGGAIYGASSCKINVTSSTFIDSTASSSGGAIFGFDVAVDNCQFKNTKTMIQGGAIYSEGNVTVTNSIFNHTAATGSWSDGGAIYGLGNVTVIGSNFNHTSAVFNGGAIVGVNNNFNVINSTFTNTSSNYGGAIVGRNNNVNVINSNFINTTANYNGGAILANRVTVKGSNFINNKAEGSMGYGGAIYGSGVTIFDSSFTNTSSYYGGAIVADVNIAVNDSIFTNTDAYHGGAIYGRNDNFTVSNSTFINTTANSTGGAIYGSGAVNVSGSTFKDTKAKSKGVAIYGRDNVNVVDSIFNSYNTKGNAIIYADGQNKTIYLLNNSMTTNTLPIYSKGPSFISPVFLTFQNVNVASGETANITAELRDDKGNLIGSSNNVIAIINGTDIDLAFNSNDMVFKGQFSIADGQYPISGNYSNATQLTVTNGTLTVGQIATITAPSIVKYYKNDTQFIVTVNEGGQPIEGVNVSITINGVTYNRTTDSNGVAKMNINLNPGVYDVNVIATGSFGVLTANATVTVLSTIYGNDTTLYYKNGTKYNVLFLDEQGNPLNNTEVSFNINGVTYKRTTNENGTTTGLAINLNPGEYIITATNSANGEMHSNNITVLSTIETENLVKYYKNGSQFVVKALDKNGQASAGQTVKFNINGVIYTKITDDNGEAKLNINLAAGNNEPKIYTITTQCNGCTVSNSIIVLPVIIGTDVELQYKSGKKYNVFVFDGQGELEEGVPITFNINGVNYHRISNSEGTTSGLTINLQPGEYIITAIRDDNGATISNNIVVNG